VLRPKGKTWQLVSHQQIHISEALSGNTYANLTAAIPYHQIICKTIKLDKSLKTKEIKQVVLAQAKQSLGDILSNAVLDFERIKSSEQEDLMNVRWIAAKCQDIDAISKYFKRFNLNISSIDVDAFALQHLAYFLAKQADLNRAVTAIFYIQNQSALLCASKNNECLFVHRAKSYSDLLANLTGFRIEKIWICGDISGNFETIADDIARISGIETVLANPFLYFNLNGSEDEKYLLENAHVYALSCALAMRRGWKHEH
jgi:Tfp pilus assembly PilM family ATPase